MSPSRNRRTSSIGIAAMGLLAAGLSVLAVRNARRGGDEALCGPAVEPSRLHAGPPSGIASARADGDASADVLAMPLEAADAAAVRQVVRATRGAVSSDAARLRAAALESRDPLVAGNAVRALGRLGAFGEDAELLALLDDPRPRLRQESVMALGEAAGREDVERLVRRLDDEDPTVRALALRALAGVDDPRAAAAVAGALADPRASRTDRAMAESARAGTGASRVSAVRYVESER